MGKYIVTTGQNIYDVALHLTGSIEGIIDLMLSNPTLSLDDTLHSGDELSYTDGFVINAEVVAEYRRNGIVPAGGERGVYPKYPSERQRMQLTVDTLRQDVGFTISGSGTLEVDWGDNSLLENIVLSPEPQTIYHRFDSVIGTARQIRIYGNEISLRLFDPGAAKLQRLLVQEPLDCEQFFLCDSNLPLDFMPLLRGTYRMRLCGTSCGSLLPVAECRELMSLDLSDADVSRTALDLFLIRLVTHHYGRRNCELTLPFSPYGEYREPSRDTGGNYVIATGMEAVWLLTHEESWNEGGDWIVHIGQETYRYVSKQSNQKI